MNKKILAAAIAAFLMTPVAFAAYTGDANGGANNGTNDDAVDLQTLSVTVPEVALLNIIDPTLTMNTSGLQAPTVAGDGFTGTATIASTYKVSSNIEKNSTSKRKITVAIASGTNTIPEGAKLDITMAAPGNSAAATLVTLKAGSTTADAVTNIGNIATPTAMSIDYSLGVDTGSATNGMIAYTGISTDTEKVDLVFTLTDD